MLFRRKKKVTQSKLEPKVLCNHDFSFLEMLKEQIEYERNRPKPITPRERCEAFRDKYKNIELRPCPLCNSKALLIISLREYTQTEGFAGGYDIFAKISCSKCKCGLDEEFLYTNIRSSDEPDNIKHVDGIISAYVKEWNERYDDLDKLFVACRHHSFGEPFFAEFQRPKSEDKPDEV